MVNFSRGASPDGAGGIADGAGIRGAKLEPFAGINFHRVEETPADEFGASNEGARGTHVFLEKLQAVDRRFVGCTADVSGQAVGRLEELYPETFAAAVRLQDHRLVREVAARRGEDAVAAGDENGAGCGDALRFQGGVLPDLADLQVERARSVDHAAAPAGEPGEHAGRQFGREAVVAGMRRGTHAVVEHAWRRRCGEVERAGIEEPLRPGEPTLVERDGERRQPGGILVQDVDAAHGVRFPRMGTL